MEASILLIADFANVDSSGKLNIIGAFNRIFANSFPVIIPQMTLVIRLTAELGEFEQERMFKCVVWNEDGAKVGELPDLPFTVPSPKGVRRSDHNVLISLQGFKFDGPGAYEFKVYVDNQHKGSIPLDIEPSPDRNARE